jgi:hypothetical protein
MKTPYAEISGALAGLMVCHWMNGNPITITCRWCKEHWTHPAHQPVEESSIESLRAHAQQCRQEFIEKQKHRWQRGRSG